ncbi:carbamoyltransferase HypF [Edaphobacter aggregans]|uniref:carbamoyltransferase HypF n=1 Tax=Edaphobacter aggregans TaxID=570835 RepID=UPI00054E518B|nr:carbamoyltransferase HypF [Edaphobacter aggregans]
MAIARSIRVRGVVQGVGFRPFVYRLAQANMLTGWVLNGNNGVEIHLEGVEENLATFVREIKMRPPAAASIAEIQIESASCEGLSDFTIRESEQLDRPTARVSPDLPICDDCLTELFDPTNKRYGYPYINCTNCGPRYSVIHALPYDRPNTTMRRWPMDHYCSHEYHDPVNRRFHAQPVACPACGPKHSLIMDGVTTISDDTGAIERTAQLLREGKIVAIKGLGGYHLACDARNAEANTALRERKFRKEKPFALMAEDLETVRGLVQLTHDVEILLTSSARPIVLASKKLELAGVAPENNELGVMLPYTPLHHLLFAAGAPDVLVMTSANRSSEPIAYEDEDALERLSGIADAFLVGERPIPRRVDDSVARASAFGPMILRRARGYAPGAVAMLPTKRPILAVGADLKNTITLVVDGQAFVSQHIGDLDHYQSFRAFDETVTDLISMYNVRCEDLLVVHDCHPQYASTTHALALPCSSRCAVQHHRAHIASVLAERGEWEAKVVGVSFDGTGYGDDGTIWGGEFFAGSVQQGFTRVAHLRQAVLPGGDAASQYPIQAAAGFLSQINDLPDMATAPFSFTPRYHDAVQLIDRGVRTFSTTSMGRLFDTAAVLLGFVRQTTFEGQAAIWLEQVAKGSSATDAYPFPFANYELDFRPLLQSVIRDRTRGRPAREIARAFQRGIAQGLYSSIKTLCEEHGSHTLVLSGGVFQNELLLEDLKPLLEAEHLQVWTNHAVPPNDGGISLGQAALAVFEQSATDGAAYA